MPIISIASAFAATLALYWLMLSVLEDPMLAMAGALVVMVGSAAISGIGAISGFFDGGAAYPFFPFLRRPIPSLAFPFFFAWFACIWNGLSAEGKRAREIYSIAGVILFTLQVFSYFYLWTASIAVLGLLTMLTISVRAERRKDDLRFLLLNSAGCLLGLLPYAWLLSNRNKMADKAQLLVLTHAPDISRQVEIIGLLGLVALLLIHWFTTAKLSVRSLAFISALLLSPLVVFNQQVITGRSLQPFHYEFYVINYVLLAGLILFLGVYFKKLLLDRRWLSKIALLMVATAVAWGCVEAIQTTIFWDDVNIQRDDAMPVNRRLRELAGNDIEKAKRETTLNLESLQADSQPTVAPQAVLWARHQHTFAGVRSWEENRKRYYQLLHFLGFDGHRLKRSLMGCEDIEACMALFGWDRFNSTLSADARPLTLPEIEAEVASFDLFTKGFGRNEAYEPMLSNLVVYDDALNDFQNIDKWYDRDEGEVQGKYILYRLSVKQ
jgi:hypothetical protein